MKLITVDRAVLEQALEALVARGKRGDGSPDTVAALRAALAQQAEPVQVAERERVASQWDGCVTHQLDTFGPVDIGASIRAGELVEAQQAEMADEYRKGFIAGQIDMRDREEKQDEPVEPVAWIYQNMYTEQEYLVWKKGTGGRNWRPLYTAPPQRTMVPLTDEEILAAVGWERAEMYMKLTPNFPVDEAKKETLTNARAVEKAVWEKNHGQA